MGILGKISLTLLLSLTLSVALFTSHASAQHIGDLSRGTIASSVILAREAVVQPEPTSQILESNNQQTSYPQTNTPQGTQGKDDCNLRNNCQHSAQCAHTFRSAWGWIFICRGW